MRAPWCPGDTGASQRARQESRESRGPRTLPCPRPDRATLPSLVLTTLSTLLYCSNCTLQAFSQILAHEGCEASCKAVPKHPGNDVQRTECKDTTQRPDTALRLRVTQQCHLQNLDKVLNASGRDKRFYVKSKQQQQQKNPQHHIPSPYNSWLTL